MRNEKSGNSKYCIVLEGKKYFRIYVDIKFQPKEILLQHFPDGPPHSLDPESLDGFDDFPTAEHSTISFR
ncbi:Protein of unknown function [Gryllus bimaculatus]|nr:Protein of unknown function [Gryllus bimaculatus]